MAEKNEEEEYLDSLLNSAIKNDSELGNNTAVKDDTDHNKEKAATWMKCSRVCRQTMIMMIR